MNFSFQLLCLVFICLCCIASCNGNFLSLPSSSCHNIVQVHFPRIWCMLNVAVNCFLGPQIGVSHFHPSLSCSLNEHSAITLLTASCSTSLLAYMAAVIAAYACHSLFL